MLSLVPIGLPRSRRAFPVTNRMEEFGTLCSSRHLAIYRSLLMAPGILSPSLAQDTISTYERVDVLIDNSGYYAMGPFNEISMTEAKSQMVTCYFGSLALVKAFPPPMRERKSGMIISISFVAGLQTLTTRGVYTASKFPLEDTSESLPVALALFNIRLIFFEPGTSSC